MRNRITIVICLTLFTVPGGPAPAGQAELGTVQLAEGMTIEIRRSMAGTDEPAVLSPGRYTLYEWSLSRTDEQGHQWGCGGVVPENSRALDVVPAGQTKLPVGEPLVATLTAVRRGPEFTFTYGLVGRLGERVWIRKDGKEGLEPRLRIQNADGSYDRSFAFEYG